MRPLSIVGLSFVVSLAASAGAFADVRLSICEGRISIAANHATAAQILAEWARVGRTTIVNLERIPRDPITIELTDVPERVALDVVLRAASGYLAAPRPPGDPDSSRYDRIVIMPPSVAPPPVAPAPAAAARYEATPPQYQPPAYTEPPPIAQPAESEETTAAAVVGEAEMPLNVDGASPIPDQRAQAVNRQRRALETVDPRSFKLPVPPEAGRVGGPPSPAASPTRVVVPGTIVPSPARRPPGAI